MKIKGICQFSFVRTDFIQDFPYFCFHLWKETNKQTRFRLDCVVKTSHSATFRLPRGKMACFQSRFRMSQRQQARLDEELSLFSRKQVHNLDSNRWGRGSLQDRRNQFEVVGVCSCLVSLSTFYIYKFYFTYQKSHTNKRPSRFWPIRLIF